MGYRKFFASICNEKRKTRLIQVRASSEKEATNLVRERFPTADIIKVSPLYMFFRSNQ